MTTAIYFFISELSAFGIGALFNWLFVISNIWTIVSVIAVLIAVGFTGYFIKRLYEWHQDDKSNRHDDLINTLVKINEAQVTLSTQLMSHHVQDLKDNFLRKLIPIIKEDEVDISKIETLLNYEFDHHVKYCVTNKKKVTDQIKRLKLHKSDDILHKISHENFDKHLEEKNKKKEEYRNLEIQENYNQ